MMNELYVHRYKFIYKYIYKWVFAQVIFMSAPCDFNRKNKNVKESSEKKRLYICFTVLCLINILHLFKEAYFLFLGRQNCFHALPRYCTICICIFIHMHINICLCNLPPVFCFISHPRTCLTAKYSTLKGDS